MLTQETIDNWQKAKDVLAEAKQVEMDLRTIICNSILEDKKKGVVHNKDFGVDVVATAKTNMKIDESALTHVYSRLSPEERKCIRYKYEVRAKEYKTLPEDSIFHTVVVETPGTPTLAIKELK